MYEIPLVLKKEGLDTKIIEKLNLYGAEKSCELPEYNERFNQWVSMIDVLKAPEHTAHIAIVGKYIGHQSSYESVYDSLIHGGIANNARVEVKRIESEDIELDGVEAHLKGCKGVLIPGGFGGRGVVGKVQAIKFARENRIPFLGLCLGMHCAVIEFAVNVCSLKGANSTEFEREAVYPVISLLEEQQKVEFKGGTMRLGAQPCRLVQGTKAFEAYGREQILNVTDIDMSLITSTVI